MKLVSQAESDQNNVELFQAMNKDHDTYSANDLFRRSTILRLHSPRDFL